MDKHIDGIDELLESVANGNRQAFDALYYRCYDRVFRTAYYFLCDIEACREVVSDVFFAIWKMGPRISGITNFESYLYIVTKNEATRRLASDEEFRRRHVPLSGLSVVAEPVADVPADADIEATELRRALSEAIDALPEKCRIIFLMSREEGADSRRIAQMLGISDSTVRVQLKIAVEKIAARIKAAFPHLSLSMALAMLLH